MTDELPEPIIDPAVAAAARAVGRQAEAELGHELSVRVADAAAVLADGIGLRCSCGWEHVEPPPSRLLRRRESDYQLVAAMSARAEQAWQEHQALDRG